MLPVLLRYFSILGGATLLVHTIHKLYPVSIASQAGSLLIYARNLYCLSNMQNKKRSLNISIKVSNR
ncbi:MAG: lipid-A-disaccharide synthase N-terminal domain-containing protein [Methylomonas lenta]|nr:lipid-A-disaccharide synthase N-terminal domain-containing protein [Methylomonas lenta]